MRVSVIQAFRLRKLFALIMTVVLALLHVSFSHAQQNIPELGQEQLQGNEDEVAEQMLALIKQVSQQRHPSGTIKRLNQAKSLGCFDGYFDVMEDIPETFRIGVFANPGRHIAYARFANASTFDDGEKDLRGLSIKVKGVEGKSLWGKPAEQDFLLNSYPVLFADSPEVFHQFIKAQQEDSILGFFLNPFDSHLKALSILLKARDRPNSPFDIRFWSTTAYRLGADDQAVKYSVKPCSSYQSPEPDDYTENYLQAAMQKHLSNSNVCFDFMLQKQIDPIDMPIEDATVEWDEEQSPFVPVARLIIEQQDFLSEDTMKACEAAAFNPWQSLPEHRPLGRINYVRRLIYEKMAEFRNTK